VISKSQDEPIPGEHNRRRMLSRVEDERDHGPVGQGQEKRSLCGYRVELEVRVQHDGLHTDGRHVWSAVDLVGLRAVVVVAVTVVVRLEARVPGRIAMRRAVPDLRRQDSEAEDQQERQAGKARPPEGMHGGQDSTARPDVHTAPRGGLRGRG